MLAWLAEHTLEVAIDFEPENGDNGSGGNNSHMVQTTLWSYRRQRRPAHK